jgi:tetratricopeptide (TPR) repeat protein
MRSERGLIVLLAVVISATLAFYIFKYPTLQIQILLRQNRLEKAEFLVKNSKFPMWKKFNLLGIIRAKEGRTDEAMEYFINSVHEKPNGEAFINMGVIEETRGNYEKAREYYRKAEEVGDFKLRKLAESYTRRTYWMEENSEQLEKAKLHKLYYQAVNEEAKGNYELAMEICDKILTVDSNYAPCYNLEGMILAKKGMIEKARESFMVAIKLSPDYVEPYINLGTLAEKEGKYQEALLEYEHALKLSPKSKIIKRRINRVKKKLKGSEKE